MANTPKLGMPEIAEAQASKYLTHNSGLRILDGLVQATVLDKDTTDAPSGPSDGDTYIVGSSPSSGDDWDGHEDKIAYYENTSWIFITPEEGWRAWVQDENLLYVYRSASVGWEPFSFVDLPDTPATLSGYGYKTLRVNQAQTALEYTDDHYDIAGYKEGVPGASEVILRFPVVRTIILNDDFALSQGSAEVAAGDSAGAEFSIQVNDVEIGTMTFASGATVATFDTASGSLWLIAGDVFTVVAPASPDSALSGVGFVFYGTQG